MSHQAQNPNPQPPFEVTLRPEDAIKEVEGSLVLALCYIRSAEKMTQRLSQTHEVSEYVNLGFAIDCQLRAWRDKFGL